MSSVNRVTLIGRLGADPETRTAGSGTTICNLRIATDDRVKRGDSWETETSWHRVVCFGRTAENAARFLTKGRQVYIDGRLKYGEYEKDGVKRYTTEIIANEVQFLGGKDGGSGGGGSYGGYGSGYRDEPQVGGPPSDDIPF